MAKRKSLGRGLDALLSTEIRPNEQAMETGLKEIPVDLLQRGLFQPRLDMREESLEELANTIRSRGLFSRSWFARLAPGLVSRSMKS